MRLFGLFGKGSKEQPKENEQKTEENSQAEITAYSGMRVEVTTFEGELLFVAKLVALLTRVTWMPNCLLQEVWFIVF